MKHVDVSLEEPLELLLLGWLVFLINDDLSVVIVLNLLDVALTATDQIYEAKSVISVLRSSIDEFITQLLVLIASQHGVQRSEWTDIIIEVHQLVAIQVLVHLETSLDLRGDIDRLEGVLIGV